MQNKRNGHESRETPRIQRERSPLGHRIGRRLGSTALGKKVKEARTRHQAKRYEGTTKPVGAAYIEKEVSAQLEKSAAQIQARYERVADNIGSPELEAVRLQQEGLAFALRAEALFAEGGNKAEQHPYTDGRTLSILEQSVDPAALPEWATRSIETSSLARDEEMTATIKRLVDLRSSRTENVAVGAPRYELRVSRASHDSGGRMTGVISTYMYDTAKNTFSAHDLVGNPNYILHGKQIGMAGPQEFPQAVKPADISQLLTA